VFFLEAGVKGEKSFGIRVLVVFVFEVASDGGFVEFQKFLRKFRGGLTFDYICGSNLGVGMVCWGVFPDPVHVFCGIHAGVLFVKCEVEFTVPISASITGYMLFIPTSLSDFTGIPNSLW
jgi:hypothetical protein